MNSVARTKKTGVTAFMYMRTTYVRSVALNSGQILERIFQNGKETMEKVFKMVYPYIPQYSYLATAALPPGAIMLPCSWNDTSCSCEIIVANLASEEQCCKVFSNS